VNRDLFVRVCGVGHGLMKLPLLEADVLDELVDEPGFGVKGDNLVEKGYPKFVVNGELEGKTKYWVVGRGGGEGVRGEYPGVMCG